MELEVEHHGPDLGAEPFLSLNGDEGPVHSPVSPIPIYRNPELRFDEVILLRISPRTLDVSSGQLELTVREVLGQGGHNLVYRVEHMGGSNAALRIVTAPSVSYLERFTRAIHLRAALSSNLRDHFVRVQLSDLYPSAANLSLETAEAFNACEITGFHFLEDVIPSVLDPNQYGDTIRYVIMDYVDGTTVSDWLKRNCEDPGSGMYASQHFNRHVLLLAKFLKGLILEGCIPEGIVLFDLKTSNLMKPKREAGFKVIDWDLMRRTDDLNTETRIFEGDPIYSPPDQSSLQDLHNLGVILLEALDPLRKLNLIPQGLGAEVILARKRNDTFFGFRDLDDLEARLKRLYPEGFHAKISALVQIISLCLNAYRTLDQKTSLGLIREAFGRLDD